MIMRRRGFTLLDLLLVCCWFLGLCAVLSLLFWFIFWFAGSLPKERLTPTVTPNKFDAEIGTFNGHSYVRFTNYPGPIHDPDCQCLKKAEYEGKVQ